MPSTVSNVDSNTDFSLVNVVTVALYCALPVIVLLTLSDPQHGVNRQWTASLGAIEGDEPSLTGNDAVTQIEVSLVNNAKGCVILGFIKLAILQRQT